MRRSLLKQLVALLVACGILGFLGVWSAEARVEVSSQLQGLGHHHGDGSDHLCPPGKPPHRCLHSTALSETVSWSFAAEIGELGGAPALHDRPSEAARFDLCCLRGPPPSA